MKTTLLVISACLLTISLWAQDLKQFEGPNGSYGYKDVHGNIVIAPKYQKTFDFKDGLGIVVSYDKWGYIDSTGKVIVELKYDELHWFSEGYAVANYGATKGELSYAIGGKYGYIDKTGKEVIPFIYDKAGSFKEGIAPVNIGAKRGSYSVSGGKWGYIDKTGKEIIPFIYDLAGPVSDGLALVGQNGKMGFIDKTGKIIIPLKYDNAGSFKQGLARVKQNGKFGYISPLDEVVIPFNFDEADADFSNGLACVKQNGLYGFIDNTGKIVIPLKFENANPFRINRAGVKSGGKWGYIDTLGNIVIDAKYDYAGMFVDGKAKVKLSGEEFTITPNGQRYYDAKTTVAKNKAPKVTKESTDDMPDLMKRMKERDELLKSMDKNYKGTDFSEVEKSYKELQKAGENYVKTEKENAELLKLADAYASKAKELGPNVEIKTKTHSLKVFSSWATIFGNKTEAYSELTTNSSDAIVTGKSAVIFSEAPAGWVNKTGKTDRFSETIHLSFEELVSETTLVQQKQKLTDYASTVSGIAKEKVKYLQEEVILNDGRKGVLFFYYTNQAQEIGYLLNCHLYAVSAVNPKKVSYYRLHMEGMENQPLAEKEFAAWKDYFKKILLTIKPITH